MEPRNQKILMRFSELVFAWVLFPYSRTTSRTLATRVGGRTKSYKYYRNRKENFLLLETSKVKFFVLISDYILGRQLITPLKNEFSPQCESFTWKCAFFRHVRFFFVFRFRVSTCVIFFFFPVFLFLFFSLPWGRGNLAFVYESKRGREAHGRSPPSIPTKKRPWLDWFATTSSALDVGVLGV